MRTTAVHFFYIMSFFILLNGCNNNTRSYNIHDQEIRTLSWFIEDLCHGVTRDVNELIQPHSSISLSRITIWLRSAHNSDQDSQQQWPLRINKRIARWKILKSGLASTAITVTQQGTLVLKKNCSELEHKLYNHSITQENHDRLSIDHLLLQHSGLPTRSKRALQLLAALRQSRIQLDTETMTAGTHNNDHK